MTKITLDELPAELAEQIREKKIPIEITDHDHAIARIVPMNNRLEYLHRAPTGHRLGDFVPPSLSFNAGAELADALHEDREKDRHR